MSADLDERLRSGALAFCDAIRRELAVGDHAQSQRELAVGDHAQIQRELADAADTALPLQAHASAAAAAAVSAAASAAAHSAEVGLRAGLYYRVGGEPSPDPYAPLTVAPLTGPPAASSSGGGATAAAA